MFVKSACTQMQPPGRRVYQKGSYTIWEVDGAEATVRHLAKPHVSTHKGIAVLSEFESVRQTLYRYKVIVLPCLPALLVSGDLC
jgi:hypothetical protein